MRTIVGGTVRRMNSFRSRIELAEDQLERDVSYSAAFLDEHVPGWASRIKNKLVMTSPFHCVLGQVFDDDKGEFSTGYIRGLSFLLQRNWVTHPFVFTSPNAGPHWEAEIARRGGR